MRENQIALTPAQWRQLQDFFVSAHLFHYHAQLFADQATEFTLTGPWPSLLEQMIGLTMPKGLKLQLNNTGSCVTQFVPQTWHQFLEHLEHTTESNFHRYQWKSSDKLK